MRSTKFLFTIIALPVSFLASSFAIEVEGKVVSVIDGNTIEFLSNENEKFNFVLSGIDCPELNQEFGDDARKHLEKILLNKSISILIEGKDRFGNRVGNIITAKEKDPRVELLEKGLAWPQEKNPNKEFEIIKEAAKSKGIGLWKQENPVAPWTFRRQQSMLTPKMG